MKEENKGSRRRLSFIPTVSLGSNQRLLSFGWAETRFISAESLAAGRGGQSQREARADVSAVALSLNTNGGGEASLLLFVCLSVFFFSSAPT